MRLVQTASRVIGLILSGTLILFSGCTVTRWKSNLGVDHPLTGRIWDVSTAGFVDNQTLVRRLTHARFVLLGEKHDNPDHHVLQAKLIRQMIKFGRRPAVAFEMFNVDDAFAIARHLTGAPGDAAGLGAAVGWEKRGWPDWELYQPIAEAALEAGLPVVATDLSPATLSRLRRGGVAALEDATVRRLQLDRPFPKDMLKKMTEDIRSSHCGHASDALIETMVHIQRARDARIAQSMIASDHGDGTVLVAGAGHARKDYGVPTHLAVTATGQLVISVAFVEVAKAAARPEEYAAKFGSTRFPFDYVWFTPRLDDLDPCESFKEELERLKHTQ